MNANVITLRIQFEDAAKNLKDFVDEGEGQMSEFGRAGEEGGDQVVTAMEGVMDDVREFDLTHPIDSIKGLSKATLRWSVLAGGAIAGIGWAFQQTLGQMLTLQSQMVDLFNEVGLSARSAGNEIESLSMGERVGDALERIGKVSFETTESMQGVAEAYASLARQRVDDDDLRDLTKTAIQTSQAIGMSVGEASDFVGFLNKVGGLANKDVREVSKEFANVQDQVGLTNNEMQTVIETAKEITMQIAAFGAEADSIEAVAGATAEVAGMFRQAGLAAESGTRMVSQLFDPDRLQENAFLINRMGIGMQEYIDMMHGGAIEQERLTEGIYAAAQDIARMEEQGVHFMALQRRAQQMGFSSAKEALLLVRERSNMTEEQIQKEKELEEAAAEGMSQLNEAFGRLKIVFQGVLAPFIAKFMEFATERLENMVHWWNKNSDAIMEGVVKALKSAWEWFNRIDWAGLVNKIKDFVVNIGDHIKTFMENMREAWFWIKVVGASLVALFVVSKLSPLIGGLASVVGTLAGKLRSLVGIASKGAPTIKGFGQAAGAGLQTFLQMAGAAAVILAIAYSMEMLTNSLVKLQDISWGTLAKAGAILAGLIGSVVLLSIMAGAAAPGLLILAGTLLAVGKAFDWVGSGIQKVGQGIEAALGGIKDFAEGLKILGEEAGSIVVAFVSLTPVIKDFATKLVGPLAEVSPDLIKISGSLVDIAEAVNKLEPSKLKELGESIDEETVKGFEKLGEAISGLMLPMEKLDPMYLTTRAAALKEAGEGVKDFAVSAWVMSKIDNVSASIKNVEDLMEGILGAFGNVTIIIGDMEALGKGFTHMTEGIERLAAIDTHRLINLGVSLEATSEGLRGWTIAMKAGSGSAWFADLEALGKGFKDLSVGIWVLSKANLGETGGEMEGMVEPLNSILSALGYNAKIIADVEELADAFGTITDSLLEFSELDNIKLLVLAYAIDKIGPAVGDWLTGVGKAAGHWFKNVKAGAEAFVITADAIGEFAKFGNISQLGSAMNLMGHGIAAWLEAIGSAAGHWFKDVKAAGEAFKFVAEGIGTIAEAKAGFGGEDFASIGSDLGSMTDGIGSMLETMNALGSGDKGFFARAGERLLTIGQDIGKTGAAFRDLGEGIAYLTDESVVGGMEKLNNSNTIGDFSNKIGTLFDSLKGQNAAKSGANILKTITEAVDDLSGLSGTLTMFDMLADSIDRLSASLSAFKESAGTGINNTAKQFKNFMKEVKAIGPVEVKSDVSAGSRGGIIGEKSLGASNIEDKIIRAMDTAITQQMSRIVDAIKNADNNEAERHEARFGVLESIKRRSRPAIGKG